MGQIFRHRVSRRTSLVRRHMGLNTRLVNNPIRANRSTNMTTKNQIRLVPTQNNLSFNPTYPRGNRIPRRSLTTSSRLYNRYANASKYTNPVRLLRSLFPTLYYIRYYSPYRRFSLLW